MSLDDDLRTGLSATVRPATPAATDAAWRRAREEADARHGATQRSRLVLAAACLLVLAVLAGAVVVMTAGDDGTRVRTDVTTTPPPIEPARARALAEATVALTDATAQEWFTTAEAAAGIDGVDGDDVAAARRTTDRAATAWLDAVSSSTALDASTAADLRQLTAVRSGIDAGAQPGEVSAGYQQVLEHTARPLVTAARASEDPAVATELLAVDGLAGRQAGRAEVGAALLHPGPDWPERLARGQQHLGWAAELADEHSEPAWKQLIRDRDAAVGMAVPETVTRAIEAVSSGAQPEDLARTADAVHTLLTADGQTAALLAARVGSGTSTPPTGRAEATELLRRTLVVQQLVDDDRARTVVTLGAQVGSAPDTGQELPDQRSELADAISAWQAAADAFAPHAAGDTRLDQARARLDGLATVQASAAQGLGPAGGERSLREIARRYESIDADLSGLVLGLSAQLDGGAVVDGGLVAALWVERGVASELAELAIDETLPTRGGTSETHRIGPRAAWLIRRHGTDEQRAALERFDGAPPTSEQVRATLATGEARWLAEVESRDRAAAGPIPTGDTLWGWWALRRAAVAELAASVADPLLR